MHYNAPVRAGEGICLRHVCFAACCSQAKFLYDPKGWIFHTIWKMSAVQFFFLLSRRAQKTNQWKSGVLQWCSSCLCKPCNCIDAYSMIQALKTGEGRMRAGETLHWGLLLSWQPCCTVLSSQPVAVISRVNGVSRITWRLGIWDSFGTR